MAWRGDLSRSRPSTSASLAAGPDPDGDGPVQGHDGFGFSEEMVEAGQDLAQSVSPRTDPR